MKNRFHRLALHESEKADETWVNPDHVVAVTPDPDERYMTVVLDILDLGGFTWGPKIYRATWDSGKELLET